MDKNKPEQTNVTTPKSRDSICWPWLQEHKYEVMSGFLVTMLAGFLVTMLGVFAAFKLEGRGKQEALNKATQQRLHLVLLEAQYNSRDVNEILDNYADANSCSINLNRPSSTIATITLQDTNILLILPLHKISLLRSYVNSISILNQSLQVHLMVLESQGLKQGFNIKTPLEKRTRQIVHENAAATHAICQVLKEELKGHFDTCFYDKEEAERLEERIKLIKRKALKL